jgi:UDP-GlcNAc:undecaprenyl-phosphate GlcNAc-1-phosphate transferase
VFESGASVFWLLLCIANAALIVSATITWTVRRLARVHGWMAGPESRRHVHTLPIPRLGGIAIFTSMSFTCLFLPQGRRLALLALIPAAWMFAIGLLDDLVGVRASRKLAAQLLGGILLFACGFRFPFHWLDGTANTVISFTLTVAWSALVMNATNLIDGLDGLASGATLFIAGSFLAASLIVGQSDTAILAMLLAGATLGFIRFNVYPASIFLGDSGSLVIGTLLSAISMRLMHAGPWGIATSVVALAHPLSEVVLSTTRRALTAKPVFRPDRRHMHHRLLDRRLSHEKSTQALVAMSALLGPLSVLIVRGGLYAAAAILLSIVFTTYFLRAFRYREFSYLKNLWKKVVNHRFVIDAHVQIREISDAVEEAESLPELRAQLHSNFTGLGFSAAKIVVTEFASWDASPVGKLDLAFTLASRSRNVGVFRLTWDLNTPPPIDVDVLRAEFLPILTRTLSALMNHDREVSLPQSSRKSGPMLVPVSMQPAGKSTALLPLH